MKGYNLSTLEHTAPVKSHWTPKDTHFALFFWQCCAPVCLLETSGPLIWKQSYFFLSSKTASIKQGRAIYWFFVSHWTMGQNVFFNELVSFTKILNCEFSDRYCHFDLINDFSLFFPFKASFGTVFTMYNNIYRYDRKWHLTVKTLKAITLTLYGHKRGSVREAVLFQGF